MIKDILENLYEYAVNSTHNSEEYDEMYEGRIKLTQSQIYRKIKKAMPPKDRLPLELQNCYMEIHRKEQNLTPLINQVRNDTIDTIHKNLKKACGE